MNKPELFNDSNGATYCPEDNKLRLYVGRVPRDEYLALKAEGWTNTPKQSEAGQGEFAATWTPDRRQTALSYAGVITDEDAGPEERAADRAERFGDYRDKRADEATGHADHYDAQPNTHGFQNYGRAVRAADRHDRIGTRAVDAWEKAEYWQRRTAGVISHALYKSTPAVRMGRIKTLEAEQRKHDKNRQEYADLWADMKKLEAITDPEEQTKAARHYLGTRNVWGEYMHPRAESHPREYYRKNKLSLYSLISCDDDPISGAEACALFFSNHSEPREEDAWSRHYKLRLAYENQMLEAQGGRAAFIEMEPGGFIGKHQIRKVNKSTATGRVVSVTIAEPANGRDRWGNEVKNGPAFILHVVTVERLPADAYRPPTDEERAAFAEKRKGEKAKAKADKEPCPLINPTDEDAEKLQEIWNEKAADSKHYATHGGERSSVLRMTQAQYSQLSAGSYSSVKTVIVCEEGAEHRTRQFQNITRADVFKVRKAGGKSYSADRVVILTDKPQKPIPWAALRAAQAKMPTVEKLRARFAEIDALARRDWKDEKWTEEERQLWADARYCGLVYQDSMTQFGWSHKGADLWKAHQEKPVLAALVESSELFTLES